MMLSASGRLLAFSHEVLRATVDGGLDWSRVRRGEREYRAQVSSSLALHIRKTRGRRPRRLVVRVRKSRGRRACSRILRATPLGAFARYFDRVATEEYRVAFVEGDGRERAVVSSREFQIDSSEYRALRDLFEAARVAGEGIGPAIEEATRALRAILHPQPRLGAVRRDRVPRVSGARGASRAQGRAREEAREAPTSPMTPDLAIHAVRRRPAETGVDP